MAEFLVVTPGVYAPGFLLNVLSAKIIELLFAQLRFFMASSVASHTSSFCSLLGKSVAVYQEHGACEVEGSHTSSFGSLFGFPFLQIKRTYPAW